MFVAEKDTMKRSFLQSQFSPKHCFTDVKDIAQETAVDARNNTVVEVPHVQMFWAGFSCKSRSRANNSSAKHINCLQRHDAEAETSFTFDAVLGYIQQCKPTCVILENVRGLLQVTVPGAVSDADYVLGCLNAAGYTCTRFLFDCQETGSPVARIRLYFVAWLHQGGAASKPGTAADGLRFLEELLGAMTIGGLPASGFIEPDPATAEDHYDAFDAEVAEPPAKAAKESPASDHVDFFRKHDVPWPVDLRKAEEEGDGKGLMFRRTDLPDRAGELLWFLHKAFPRDDALGPSEVEFVDVNCSIGRLVASENESPWKSPGPTIIGSSRMCVRYLHHSHCVVRPLTPLEAFAMIGFAPAKLRYPVALDARTMRNMAGNAFSGFAFAPMLAVAMTGFGMFCRSGPQTVLQTIADAPSDNDPGISEDDV